jgi:hypothetical protein
LKPTGGLLNLPLYNWRSLYTTNFDDLIEQCYKRRDLPTNVYSSDFDFRGQENALAQKVFKLHGTIQKDVVDGDRSRIILTDGDYDQTSLYREQLYARLKSDLAGAMLIILGHSAAPGERVPRHRLIRNLIASGDYDKAETEIRVFEADFSLDGPVYRYKVDLLVARASKSPGLMTEDRVTILEEARDLALVGMNRFALNKSLLAAYAEVGVQYYKLVGAYSIFDEAMSRLREAEEKLGDPDLNRVISRLERRIQGQATEAEVA